MPEELNNAALLALLKNDVEAFNKYRKDNPDQGIDFYRGGFFMDADLEGAKLQGSNLEGANLTDANLLRANLTDANLEGANLTDANLLRANLTNAKLQGSNLRDAGFTNADLRNADLYRADLEGVMFSRAKLRGAKLPYDAPAVPDIHQRLAEVVNEKNLEMGDWHTCETTHCRAGWVVTLAGEAGRELEGKIGTNAAAALIYMASDPELERIPNWVADNEDALADIQEMAAKQRG